MRRGRGNRGQDRLRVTADDVDHGRAGALERNVQEIDAGRGLEQFCCQMQEGSDAGRRILHSTRLAFCQRDDSLSDFAGRSGLTATTAGVVTMLAIGAKDVTGSNVNG